MIWCHFSSTENMNSFNAGGKTLNAAWTYHSFAWSFCFNFFRSIFTFIFRKFFFFLLYARKCEINLCIVNLMFCLKYPQHTEKADKIIRYFPFESDATFKFYGFRFVERTFAMEHSSLWRSFQSDTMCCMPVFSDELSSCHRYTVRYRCTLYTLK